MDLSHYRASTTMACATLARAALCLIIAAEIDIVATMAMSRAQIRPMAAGLGEP